MEVEQSPQEVAKKMWKIVRIAFHMMRNGITKSKFMLDLHMMLKKGKIASKAISSLMLNHHYYSTLTCRSDDVHMSFVSPREYEFSCSNSPANYIPSYSHTKRKYHHHYHRHHGHGHRYFKYPAEEINVVQKVFDMLNSYEQAAVEASPLALPGFGRSPMVRQLRVTDSPFPLKDFEENPQVDKDCEDFIKKFYKDLKQQRKIASMESPSPYHNWAR